MVFNQLITARGLEAMLAAQLLDPGELVRINAEELVILKANVFKEMVSNESITKILKQSVKENLNKMDKVRKRGK